MTLSIALFIIGFAILVKGADVLVSGSVSLARKLNISGLLIGLVIVGIGTSIPEFAVAFLGNLLGEGEISIGTIAGSNTFNILFILGLSAVIYPLALRPAWVRRDLLWNIFAVAAALLAALPIGTGFAGITRGEGFLLLLLFIVWLIIVLRTADGADQETDSARILALPIALLFILAGLLGIVLGGKWVVDGAVTIARVLGLSEAFIGLTLVGIGTSLPELAVSALAAWRRQPGIAIGNIIGSNIFDFLMILGVSAIFRPLVFPAGLEVDMAATLGSAILLLAAVFIGRRYILKGWQGFFFVLLYLLYFFFLLGRG